MSTNTSLPRPPSDLKRGLLRGLFDDASLFPPAGLTMPAAVAGHARHASAWYSDVCGLFVCPQTRLADLATAMTARGTAWLDLSLLVTGGPSAVPGALDAVAGDPRLRLRAVEVAAAGDNPADAITQITEVLDSATLAAAAGYVEIPVGQVASRDGGALLELAAGHGYRVKLRTGGVTAEAFPGEGELARCLAVLCEHRVSFKCTAGLHHAVRHTAADTGFEHHGFLNVLLAVAAAEDGASPEEIAGILAQRDPGAVAAAVLALEEDTAADIRWLFTSFGTCSTDEPVADLVALGLLDKP